MKRSRAEQLLALYSSELLGNIVPFWSRHAPDRKHGGYFCYLDRRGNIYSPDKPVWLQGRAVWMYAKLYRTIERRSDWIELAGLGYEFLTKHAFDADGRMFFLLTRDGKPLRKRRYVFSEAFAAIACAEYGTAVNESEALSKAKETFSVLLHHYRTPGAIEPKVNPHTRPMKALSMPMIVLATVQELRGKIEFDALDTVADDCVREIVTQFYKPRRNALLENVGPHGEELFDIPAGRLVNPGHAIESVWFLLHEARYRNDASLLARALAILDSSLERGWDWEYGGLFSFVDIDGKPVEQLEWDMKMWWPHTEALYATLLAHHITGDDRYLKWFERIHAYTFEFFPDRIDGEWFGYLHRDGSVANEAKGGLWKGLFHVPRALWLCMNVFQEMLHSSGGR